MPELALRNQEAGTGSVLVIGFGGAIIGGALYHFVRETRELAVVWPPVVALLINLLLGGVLVYAGWQLRTVEFRITDLWRVVAWCFGGAAMVGLTIALSIGVRIAEGRTVAEPVFPVLIAIGIGGVTGFLMGLKTVRAQQEAREAQQARETLAFLNQMLRHELLNGTNIIQGYANRLADEIEDTAQTEIDVIQSRSEELADLVQSIRPAARAFRSDSTLHSVDLSTVLSRRIERFQVTYPEAEIAADIPENVHVQANDALEHVFQNLLANAVDHNDSPIPRVMVDVTTSGDTVHTTIADNGPGIDADRKEEIFEPNPHGEHGFGLYLVRTLISRYGGEIRVKDTDRRGCVFIVELPRATTGDDSQT